MNLIDINFPIFPIRSYYKMYNEEGIIYVETYIKTWILDNTNLPYNSLAKRRLRINKPYPLTGVIFNITQLIKCKYKVFIDNKGKIFNYKKTKRITLKYKILSNYKINYKTNEVACFTKDLPYPFYVSSTYFNKFKQFDNLYLGVLAYLGGHILYEITNEKKRDTWKKI